MIQHPISLRCLQVAAVRDVTPGMRAIALSGAELGAFERGGIACEPFTTQSPDDHVKLFFERDGALVLPTQDIGHLDWPDDDRLTARDYTVRRYDARTATLEIEALTGHAGPGGNWARAVQVGDPVYVAGPPYSLTHPVDHGALLLIGDDSALPAIARFFDESTADARAIVFVEPDQRDYPLPADRVVRVIGHDAAALGELLDAEWEHRPPDYVWGGLEYSAARQLRRELKTRQLAGSYVSHYWRRDEADRARALHDAQARLAGLTDLITPWAVRVAATLGVADAIAGGATTAASIADACGANPIATRTLLNQLATKGVFRRDGEHYLLTPVGELLLDGDEHEWRDFLHLDRASGLMAAGLDGMRDAVVSGRAGFELRHGQTFWQHLDEQPDRGAVFDAHLGEWADEWSPSIIADPVWDPARTVVDIGGGSGTFAAALLDAHAHLTVTVVELPETAARATELFARRGLAGRAAVAGQSFFEPLPAGADVYVLAQVLHDWPDAEATRILRRAAEAAGAGGTVVVLERLDSGDADEHAEMSLLMLTLFGSRERTVEEYRQLFGEAGLCLAEVRHTGPLAVLLGRPGAAD